ncbi:MAG: Cna B-type domain-containing protein, partial [Helcococcus sp.]|nr:Cna B-type domain-containing protein [Helcococcus sp.]
LIKIEDKWFKVSYEGNMKDGFIILNKEPIPWTPMEPPYRNIKIEKKWELLGDQKPVEKIEVELYKDGIATGKKIELNASNNWIGEFEGLEVADKLGSTDYYQYTVKEVGEDNGLIKIEDKWFKVSYEGNMKDGLNIVNKYEEPKKPNKPKQPENPNTNIPNKRNPKTGDSHSTFLYIIVIVISLLGLLLLKLRKEKIRRFKIYK